MALSTYLPLADSLSAEISDTARNNSLFMAHGLHDDIVKYEYGVNTRLLLDQAGLNIEWHDYPMSHSVCQDEIRHIRQWILRCLA